MEGSSTGPQTFSPADLKARYAAERNKRLRPDGLAQYRELSGVFADFDRDPYADPGFKREPCVEETDIAIIGAGFGGMLAAVELTKRGRTDFKLIDKAGDFGGTWYWNRYPGAACDIESYIYMPLLEETGYVPTEKYAKATEIFAHCQRIARHFDLYPRALFQTVVKEVRWKEEDSRWLVRTDRGDVISARFIVIAGGVLHKAKLPGIPGIEAFKGHSFHSGRWDYAYTGGSPTEAMEKLADKRVALIGTGATSVQIAPKLAETAGQLYVVQRTPSSVGVRNNRPTDPEWKKTLRPGWQKARIENFTRIVSGDGASEADLVDDGFTAIFRRNPNAFGVSGEEQQLIDFQAMEAIRARIDEIVTDRATAEALKPWYNQMCKRPCFHDAYLAAFNRPNVKLLDTAGKGAERITESGVVVAGVEYPVDCIVYASGFEVGTTLKSRLGFEIHGRGGLGLAETWMEQGASTLHGITASRFPNMVLFNMTQGGFAINFVHMLWELAEHGAWLISRCLEEGIEQIEPSPEAEEAWFQRLLGNLGSQAMFLAECTPSYLNGEGTRSADLKVLRGIPYFGRTMEYIQFLRDWRMAGDFPGMQVKRGPKSA
jgi:cation diffusion facilitator CzcD-associated flavoprotein CzcO